MEPILATERSMTDNGNRYAALRERRVAIDGELRLYFQPSGAPPQK
jgi:hypothetical protein